MCLRCGDSWPPPQRSATVPCFYLVNVNDRDTRTFFSSVRCRLIGEMIPVIAGYKHATIHETTAAKRRSQEMPAGMALGIYELPFFAEGPAKCATMARATANGNLSRSESP